MNKNDRRTAILGSIGVVIIVIVAFIARSWAATTGTSTVTLAAAKFAQLQIVTAGITLTPTQTDMENDFVQATGAAGITVNIRTNSSAGCTLSVRCADATPAIALADLSFKTPTAGGGAGTKTTYTAITAANQTLYNQTTKQSTFKAIGSDIEVQNLWNYDATGAGVTNYQDTLTYTVVVN